MDDETWGVRLAASLRWRERLCGLSICTCKQHVDLSISRDKVLHTRKPVVTAACTHPPCTDTGAHRCDVATLRDNQALLQRDVCAHHFLYDF